MLKGIIFDFDGTLFDSMHIWDDLGEVYLRSLGKEPKADINEILYPMSLIQSAEYLKSQYEIPLSVSEIIYGINRITEDFYFHTALPKPSVIPFLRELQRRDIRMCIATATDRYLIEAALQRCGIFHFFSEIFTCTEVGQGKDRPDIFRRAMANMKTDRSTTAVFEDAYHAALTAKKDGFRVVCVYDPHEKRQRELSEISDLYLPDYSDLSSFWRFASAL